MQTQKSFRVPFDGRWIYALTAILVLPLPAALAQSQVSLKTLKLASKASAVSRIETLSMPAAPAFVPLPGPQVPESTPPTIPPPPKSLGGQTLLLKELPKANQPAFQPKEMPPQTVEPSSPESAQPTPEPGPTVLPPPSDSDSAVPQQPFDSAPTLPVAIFSSFQVERKDSLTEMSKLFLDVNSLIGGSANSQKVFRDLQTDRRYMESATLVEPVRMQRNSETVPYLWNAHGYAWESATFCFSPLYFEQPNVERYGQGVGRPFASTISAVKFVSDVTTLPIAVICTPPWSCSCSLGHHRPGDCAPCQRKTTDH